jgi:hypothetical protein
MHSVADLIKVVVIVNKILSAIEKAGKTGVYDSAVGAELQAGTVSIDEFSLIDKILSAIGNAGKTGVYDSAVGAELQADTVSIDEFSLIEIIKKIMELKKKLSDIGSAYCCCCSSGIPFTPEQIIAIILILKTIISDLKLIFKVQAAVNNIDFSPGQIDFIFIETAGGGCTSC